MNILAVSQSGSKAKLWSRIIATVDRQRILEETQLSVPALTGDSIQPRSVQLAERPGEDEVQHLMLTHSPYAAWCEACVSSKGKPDRHERDETRVRDREIPVLSVDFAFTGKSWVMIKMKMRVQSLQHWFCMILTVVQLVAFH